MKSRLLVSDVAVFAIASGLLVLYLVLANRGIWLQRTILFDRIGSVLICAGVWLFFMGRGVLPPRGRRVGFIPYPILGALVIIQGIALAVFHVRS